MSQRTPSAWSPIAASVSTAAASAAAAYPERRDPVACVIDEPVQRVALRGTVEQPGPFGLLFSAKDRLFVAAPDGYLTQAADGDLADLEEGQTLRIAASFYVPAAWEPRTMAFTVRTADEIRELMSGNICRCGAYSNIIDAIADVAGITA